ELTTVDPSRPRFAQPPLTARVIEQLGTHHEPVESEQRGDTATVAFHQGPPVDVAVGQPHSQPGRSGRAAPPSAVRPPSAAARARHSAKPESKWRFPANGAGCCDLVTERRRPSRTSQPPPAIWNASTLSLTAGTKRLRGQGSLTRNTRGGRLDLVFPEPPATETTERVGRAESRWPPALAVLVFVVLNVGVRLWRPTEHVIALPWLPPAIELVLLGVLLASDPLGLDRRSRWFRRASIVLVLLLVAASLWTTVILIEHLINGAPQTNSAGF